MRNYLSMSLLVTALVFSCTPQVSARHGKQKTTPNAVVVQTMHGSVSTSRPADAISNNIDDMVTSAIEFSEEAKKHSHLEKHYGTKAMRVLKASKDTVNYMLCDRGFMPSMEGGKLMLDEEVKANSKDSASFHKQRWLDKTHDAAVSNLVDLATAMGTSDPERKEEMITQALASIKELSGPESAQRVYKSMLQWTSEIANQSATPKQDPVWTLKQRQAKVDAIVATCASNDPIAAEIVRKVHRYSNHGKLVTKGSQLFETALNAVSLSPTMMGPAAQAALLAFFMATGGCEEDKLITEMYLGKRMQSRKNSFSHQANIAVEGYQLGLLTANVPLTKCSESLVRRLGGPDLWDRVFTSADTPPATTVATSADSDAAVAHSTSSKAETKTEVSAIDKGKIN